MLVDKKNKTGPRFEHRMEMYLPGGHFVLTAYFDTAVKHLRIFGDYYQLRTCNGEVDGLVFRRTQTPDELEIQVPTNWYENWSDMHPITELCHRTFNEQQEHIPRLGIQSVFPTKTVEEWFRRQSRVAVSKDLPLELEKLCQGYARFYFRLGDDSALVNLSPNAQLFGLTWIFPCARSFLKSVRPNCFELDGTFECLEPYTLEIFQAVVANESVPIGLGITPTETTASFARLYGHLVDILGDEKHLLKDIPILSDRGKGLKSFTSLLHLIHLICHWHLIHGAGASSIGGDWFRRLLGAGNLAEAKEVAAAIRCEMAAFVGRCGRLFVNDSYEEILLNMLGDVENDREDALAWWARWARPGCPTTTNAAESVHALINELTHHTRSFFQALKLIKKRLWQRFDERDSYERKRDRSTNRLCDKAKLDKMTEGNREFYTQLRRIGAGGPLAGVGWQFPEMTEPIPRVFPDPEWILIRERLPPDWATEAARKKALRKEEQERRKKDKEDKKDTADPVVEDSPAYWSTGRLILRTAKLIAGARKFNQDVFAAAVWGQGQSRGLAQQAMITPKEQTAWRIAVYEQLNLLPPPPPKT
jgi:hypothetical protein